MPERGRDPGLAISAPRRISLIGSLCSGAPVGWLRPSDLPSLVLLPLPFVCHRCHPPPHPREPLALLTQHPLPEGPNRHSARVVSSWGCVIKNIQSSCWRGRCGTVLRGGRDWRLIPGSEVTSLILYHMARRAGGDAFTPAFQMQNLRAQRFP